MKTGDVIPFPLCKAEIQQSRVPAKQRIPDCARFLRMETLMAARVREAARARTKTRQHAAARRLHVSAGTGAISSFLFSRGSSRITLLSGAQEKLRAASYVRACCRNQPQATRALRRRGQTSLSTSPSDLSNTLYYLLFAHIFERSVTSCIRPRAGRRRCPSLLEDGEYKPTHEGDRGELRRNIGFD